MKLFKYQMGTDEKLGAAKDEKDAYDRRAEVDHTFNFLPVQITEVKIDGYEIILSGQPSEDPNIMKNYLTETDRTELKAYLKMNDVEFVPQWGEAKLRETALQHYNKGS